MQNDYIIVMDRNGGAHLEHRSHKYTKREWIGGNKGWRYFYDTAITGRYHKTQSAIEQKKYDNLTKDMESEKGLGGIYKTRRYNMNEQRAEHARYAYNHQKLYEKSLAGRVEKGKKIIDSLLSKLKKKVNETAISAGKKLGLKTQQVETRTDISTGQKWKRVNGGPWEKVK